MASTYTTTSAGRRHYDHDKASTCPHHQVWDLDNCRTCQRVFERRAKRYTRDNSREIASTRNDRYGR